MMGHWPKYSNMATNCWRTEGRNSPSRICCRAASAPARNEGPLRWLRQPRPLFMRALAGFIPRSLALLLDPSTLLFWIMLATLATGLLALIMWHYKRLNLDIWMLWSFTASPLVHDYDLIQLIPLLETRALRIAALVLSLPCWLVMIFAYANDSAWYAFSLIPPGLLLVKLLIERRTDLPVERASA